MAQVTKKYVWEWNLMHEQVLRPQKKKQPQNPQVIQEMMFEIVEAWKDWIVLKNERCRDFDFKKKTLSFEQCMYSNHHRNRLYSENPAPFPLNLYLEMETSWKELY